MIHSFFQPMFINQQNIVILSTLNIESCVYMNINVYKYISAKKVLKNAASFFNVTNKLGILKS